ncbi:hypothetical protein ACQ4M4_10565 [Leptolyngbya sp. AN02str]|uniref:hypothetical protein n=1 Tax=Leptolyngbya sp. AN02str TaxID=3423363 RepID=UPI003D31394B
MVNRNPLNRDNRTDENRLDQINETTPNTIDNVNTRRVTPTEVAYRDGYAEGRTNEHRLSQTRNYRETDSFAGGAFLGIILASIVALMAGIIYVATRAPEEAPANTTAPGAVEPGVNGTTVPPAQPSQINVAPAAPPTVNVAPAPPPDVNVDVIAPSPVQPPAAPSVEQPVGTGTESVAPQVEPQADGTQPEAAQPVAPETGVPVQ